MYSFLLVLGLIPTTSRGYRTIKPELFTLRLNQMKVPVLKIGCRCMQTNAYSKLLPSAVRPRAALSNSTFIRPMATTVKVAARCGRDSLFKTLTLVFDRVQSVSDTNKTTITNTSAQSRNIFWPTRWTTAIIVFLIFGRLYHEITIQSPERASMLVLDRLPVVAFARTF